MLLTKMNDEVLAYIAEPTQLPVAYAIADWLEGGDVRGDIPAEARQLLSTEANVNSARKIRDAVSAIEPQVFETFWGNVEVLLKEKLDHSKIRGWRVSRKKPDDREMGFISLLPVAEGIDENNLFQVSAENLQVAKRKEPGFFGIWKGETNKHDSDLSAQLKELGFRPNNHWCGWKWFQACGVPDFTMTRDNVLRLNADNQSSDKPLANEVAQILWQLFESNRASLERLNRVANKINW